MNPMPKGEGLVSGLHFNSLEQNASRASVSRSDTSRHHDKVPVLSQQSGQATSEKGTLFDQEHFTFAWISAKNALCSIIKEP